MTSPRIEPADPLFLSHTSAEDQSPASKYEFQIDDDLLESVTARAAQRGETVTSVIRKALQRFIDDH